MIRRCGGFWRSVWWAFRSGIPVRIERLRPGHAYPGGREHRHFDFDIPPSARVLDIGSGGCPFPRANFLVDRYRNPTPHRAGEVVRAGRPLTVADVQALPFDDKSFDFVCCCHMLEHVEDPIRATAELMRVAGRGYIETPTFMKDGLFCWAGPVHKWHVVGIADALCFFEYSPRQLEGIRSAAWHDIVFSRWHHPIQEAFVRNQDLFNVVFPWRDRFSVYVFRLDGSVQSSNARIQSGRMPRGRTGPIRVEPPVEIGA